MISKGLCVPWKPLAYPDRRLAGRSALPCQGLIVGTHMASNRLACRNPRRYRPTDGPVKWLIKTSRPMEFGQLEQLVLHAGRPLTHMQMLRHVRGAD